ncbi:hypothetical protein C488_02540 [Natrinema pellirubrum DSM 15624]|uniref:Uncharacterized protein n=1 Tax=Natrinema pellirubrum (strain DSM 15624 / CIP 106293 / JCM 10476 / NCIMB 786 / 157) TaxID=797303 RepID=L9Z293_NATP1|nr:hypothetical protein C488_02540 [Natrinema pellirubrum DSM 15624]
MLDRTAWPQHLGDLRPTDVRRADHCERRHRSDSDDRTLIETPGWLPDSFDNAFITVRGRLPRRSGVPDRRTDDSSAEPGVPLHAVRPSTGARGGGRSVEPISELVHAFPCQTRSRPIVAIGRSTRRNR